MLGWQAAIRRTMADVFRIPSPRSSSLGGEDRPDPRPLPPAPPPGGEDRPPRPRPLVPLALSLGVSEIQGFAGGGPPGSPPPGGGDRPAPRPPGPSRPAPPPGGTDRPRPRPLAPVAIVCRRGGLSDLISLVRS